MRSAGTCQPIRVPQPPRLTPKAAGAILTKLAFQAAPLAASLPAISTVDPLRSIVVGVAVHDEHVNRGPGGGTVLVALLLLMGAAVIQLARTPAHTGDRIR